MRAIAVLAILAFHLELAGFTGGFVGVDIFFVISGYVIVLKALSEIRTLENVTVVYPHTVLCNADTCAVADGHRSLYLDDDHLSPFGSARIVAMIHSVTDLKDTALIKRVKEARGLTP